jgi:two-component sensor histidine kinase
MQMDGLAGRHWRHRDDDERRILGARRGPAVPDLQQVRELLDLTCDAMHEGVAICGPVRDAYGRLTGFHIVHVNAALRRMLGDGCDPTGRDLDDVLPPMPFDWLAACRKVFESRRPHTAQCKGRFGSGAFEVRLTPTAADKLVLLVTDRTQVWLEERRQAERFTELNHRMKNNLANVAGLLRLQAARTADVSVREQLGKAAGRVEAISGAHASLYRFGDHEAVDLGAYLTDLCERLGKGLVDEGRVMLDADVVSVPGPIESTVPLGIIVNELVTNAAKYAYTGAMTGEIRVCLQHVSDGLSLTVSDRGNGLPTGAAAKPDGLGMRLVRSLVRQLDGTLTVRDLQPGTAFEIRLARPSAEGAGPQARLL